MQITEIQAEGYHYVTSNPPYGLWLNGNEYAHLDFAYKEHKQGGKFENKVQSEVLFCELAYKHLLFGGKAGLLIPNSILNNGGMQKHRNYLTKRMRLWCSISIPAHAFYFANTNVNTGFICLEKWQTKKDDYPIVFCIVENIGFDERGRKTNKNDIPQMVNEFINFQTTQKNE